MQIIPASNIEKLKVMLGKIQAVRYLCSLHQLFRAQGAKSVRRALFRKLRTIYCEITWPGERKQFQKIIADHAGQPIILFPPLVNWHIPLYQRPQHIARKLAENGFLYFYCTDNSLFDEVQGYEPVSDCLYITNRYRQLLSRSELRVIHLYSSDNRTTWGFVEQELKHGNLILYEYIDEIHDQVSGFAIPAHTYVKHEKILGDERCMVIATADKLYREVLRHRSKNCALVSNGVDCQHFAHIDGNKEMPSELKKSLQPGRPVIGYFGALASWFDYDLVLRTAQERPDYDIVLIGWDYDRTMVSYRLDSVPNLHVIGPIAYSDLPGYARWFDVATIPFLVNEITESTSPIKLFEYMALGKPIVTTGMPECRKYKSVLIGEDHGDFIAKLDLALTLRNDAGYQAVLQKEALENSGRARRAPLLS